MNLKVAHLVTVQFGIFIGIVICLVFSRFEPARPRTAAEMRELATEHAAAVERMSEPDDEFADLADNEERLEPAEPLTEQAAALPNEYSPEAVEKSMALLTKLYYEQIAPRRNPSSSRADSSITTVAPSYTEVAPEPALVQIDDPAPQTVAYVQPTQFVVYPQPAQVVVFSNPRCFVSRCRPSPHSSALVSSSHRRPDGGGTHLSTSTMFERLTSPSFALRRPAGSPGVADRRNTGVPSCPPTGGFNPRGTR
jgi:hypothetical protein